MPYFAQPLTDSSNTARAKVGDVMQGADGTEYIYVLLDAGAASFNTTGGQVLSWLDADAYEATLDESAGNDIPAGVTPAGASFTDAHYAYIQRKGPHSAVQKPATGSDTWAETDFAQMHATADGQCAKTTAPPTAAERARYLGRATGASVDGTGSVDTVPLFLDIA